MLKQLVVLVTAILLSFNLAGCKYDKNKEAEKELQNQTVEGIDANNDGIRDDVYNQLHKEYGNSLRPDEMRVLEENARVFQEMITVNLDDKIDVLAVRDHFDLWVNCGILVFGDDLNYDTYTIILTNIRKWTFNTAARRDIRRDFVFRAREYHYEPTNFNGENTCLFDLSPDTLKLIEIRKEIAKQKEEAKLKKEGKIPENTDASKAIEITEAEKASIDSTNELQVKNAEFVKESNTVATGSDIKVRNNNSNEVQPVDLTKDISEEISKVVNDKVSEVEASADDLKANIDEVKDSAKEITDNVSAVQENITNDIASAVDSVVTDVKKVENKEIETKEVLTDAINTATESTNQVQEVVAQKANAEVSKVIDKVEQDASSQVEQKTNSLEKAVGNDTHK